MQGGSAWDIAGGKPDPYVQFSTGSWGVAGQTSTKDNVASTSLSYGSTTMWRGDKGAAAAIYNTIRGDEEEYVTVTEYAHCTPKKLVS
jgi:hypothetical protein